MCEIIHIKASKEDNIARDFPSIRSPKCMIIPKELKI